MELEWGWVWFTSPLAEWISGSKYKPGVRRKECGPAVQVRACRLTRLLGEGLTAPSGSGRLYSVYEVRGQPRGEMWPVETVTLKLKCCFACWDPLRPHHCFTASLKTDNTKGVLTETLYLSTEGFCQCSSHRTNTPKCCSVQICHRGGGGGRGGGCCWGAPRWWLPSWCWFELMSPRVTSPQHGWHPLLSATCVLFFFTWLIIS